MIKKEKIKLLLFMLLCFYFGILQSEINWSIPVTISSANFNVSDPQIVIDSQGNATSAWVENNLVKTSSMPVNGAWSTPITLSGVLAAASYPKLGIDSSGNVTALWLENGIVNSSTQILGGTWSIGLPISSIFAAASSPVLSVDQDGHAVAAWVSGGLILSSTRTLGVWSLPTTLSAGNSDNPQIAISANGTVIAVWHSVVSGADVIMYAIKTFGGAWSTAKGVFSGTASLNHNYPKVAIDSNGNAYVAWFRYTRSGASYLNVTLLTSSLTYNGNSWTIPSALSNPCIRNPVNLMLKLACNTTGNVIAFWTNSYDGQIFNVESSAMHFGGRWIPFVMLNNPSLYSLAADIDVSSSGHVLAVYMTGEGGGLAIHSQESDIASPLLNQWTMSNPLSQGIKNGYPRCAITLSGTVFNAAAIWLNYNGAHIVLQASTGFDFAVLPPTALYVVQNSNTHKVYTEYSNTISWHASPSPDIQQYNVYRNGVFFASTDPNTLQIIDHNVSKNGSVVYGVAAQDINNIQSAIATVAFP